MTRSAARSLRILAICLVAAASAISSPSTPACADPGLWAAKAPNATVYLFGTVHLLRKEQAWESPAVVAALARSQELWLEVPNPDNAKEARGLLRQFGFDSAHPLSSKLPHDAVMHLDAAARSLGIAEGETAFEPMRPWLAAVVLGNAFVVRAGYDPASGVEASLFREAVAAGKSVRGFESLEQQTRFFADMKPELELQFLQNELQDFDQGPRKLDRLVEAWRRGDDAAITQMLVEEIKGPYPALYRILLVDRNQAWADTIAAMLKGPGVRFVAVGAAHLAGPDSVQAALERRAVHVERITSNR